MEAASPKIVLERLKEEWTGVADASVYRELELEKQLWTLSALRSLHKPKTAGTTDEIQATEVLAEASGSIKVLSLYENHGEAHS